MDEIFIAIMEQIAQEMPEQKIFVFGNQKQAV